MTCIVGWVDGETTWLGADAASVSGWSLEARPDSKVFRVGPALVAISGSWRVADVLRYHMPKLPKVGADVTAWMVKEFVPVFRGALDEAGALKVENGEVATPGNILVALPGGYLYGVQGDLAVIGPVPYTADGCGVYVALGALKVLRWAAGITNLAGEGVTGDVAVNIALAAAEEHNIGVRGPFTVEGI